MTHSSCCFAALLFCAGASAGPVVYTDSAYPVPDGQNVPVILLDAPGRAVDGMFGQLSSNPSEAEQQARAVIASSQFQGNQKAQAASYAGLARAWSLKLDKYPAVVFDDTWVVYGTADVSVATQQLNAWKEAHQ